MRFEGRVWRFGDDVDTDVIIPARFLNVSDRQELAKNCFVDLRPEFAGQAQAGDIVVAGKNFGCGSSREHAPLALKEAGICIVLAKSFARIFYRNAFFIGLPAVELAEAPDAVEEGDRLSVDLATGQIEHMSGQRFTAKPIPDFMMEIVRAGGLVNYVKRQVVQSR